MQWSKFVISKFTIIALFLIGVGIFVIERYRASATALDSIEQSGLQVVYMPFVAQRFQNQSVSGPGFAGSWFDSESLFKPVGLINTPQGEGYVHLFDGYLFVPFSSDKSDGNGGFAFYDISDPRNPTPVYTYQNDETYDLNEAHGYGFSGDLLVYCTTPGIDVWDLSQPSNPQRLGQLDLATFTGYGNTCWSVAIQAPYAYVGTGWGGLRVVDFSNPQNPQLVTTLMPEALGGVSPHNIQVVGNLLFASTTDNFSGFATVDISKPDEPKLLAARSSDDNSIPQVYSTYVNGDRFYSVGVDKHLYIYDVSDPTRFQLLGSAFTDISNGGYMAVQDHYLFAGFSDAAVKFDISDPTNPEIVGSGSGEKRNRDEDFAVPIGNLMYVGDDKNKGSHLLVHQTEPDLTGPAVTMVIPRPDSENRPLSSRIGLTLSDMVTPESVNAQSVIIREVGGIALSGRYSVQLDKINFWPDQALQPNRTYEIILPAGGVKDWSNNPISSDYRSTFKTAGLNLALDAVATASSDDGPGFTAVMANDGDHNTRWNGARNSGGDTWLSLDFGSEQRFDEVNIVDFDNRITEFSLQIFDSGSWSSFYSGSQTGRLSFPAITASQIRFYVHQISHGTSAGLWEFEVIAADPPAGPLGCQLAATLPIEVGQRAPLQATIDNRSGTETYSWQLGDGTETTSGSERIDYQYAQPGNYPVVLTVRNTAGEATSCSGYQIVHRPVGEARPPATQGILYHAGTDLVINVNPDNDTATAMTVDAAFVWDTPVGDHPISLGEAPNGEIWVVNRGSSTLSIIEPGTGQLLRNISLPAGGRPYGILFDADGKTVYVTLEGSGQLLLLDVDGNQAAALDVGPSPRSMALLQSGATSQLLINRFISDDAYGEVVVVDTESLAIVKRIELSIDTGPDSESGDALMEESPDKDALPLLAFALQRLWGQFAASGALAGLIEDAADLDAKNLYVAITRGSRRLVVCSTQRLLPYRQ